MTLAMPSAIGATQTVPLLLMLASGFLASRVWSTSIADRPLKNATSMPYQTYVKVAAFRCALRDLADVDRVGG